ncbi:protease insulinase family [Photobacterium aphoticum]|nr:protease insulinase family [Photobacterium aphoticum]
MYSLPDNFVETRNDIAASITKDRIDALAAKWFNPNDYQIIVVGDAKSLKPQFQAMGLPVRDMRPMQ